MQRDPTIAAPVLGTIATTGREALTEMRSLLGVLGAPEHGAPGHGAEPRAPQPSLSDLEALVSRVRAAGTPTQLTEHGSRVDLGRSGELAAYRVVQEALTNVVKHAGPGAQAAIDLRWTSGGLAVEIRDDGRTPFPASTGGRGITGMRERVDLLGGDLDVGPRAHGGYLVRARIPMADRETEKTAQ